MKNYTVLTGKLFAFLCIFSSLTMSVDFTIAQVKNLQNENVKVESVQLKFALMIGITKYKSDKLNKIDGCQNNVPALRETLVKSYGFNENNVVSLLNEQSRSRT